MPIGLGVPLFDSRLHHFQIAITVDKEKRSVSDAEDRTCSGVLDIHFVYQSGGCKSRSFACQSLSAQGKIVSKNAHMLNFPKTVKCGSETANLAHTHHHSKNDGIYPIRQLSIDVDYCGFCSEGLRSTGYALSVPLNSLSSLAIPCPSYSPRRYLHPNSDRDQRLKFHYRIGKVPSLLQRCFGVGVGHI
jgi:hypothetical protein